MKKVEELFRTLAEENRIRILKLLLTVDEACVCELIDALHLPQYTVSRNLAALKRIGIVNERREGTWKYYSVKIDPHDLSGKILTLIKNDLNLDLHIQDLTRFNLRLSLRVNGRCVIGNDGMCCNNGECNQ